MARSTIAGDHVVLVLTRREAEALDTVAREASVDDGLDNMRDWLGGGAGIAAARRALDALDAALFSLRSRG